MPSSSESWSFLRKYKISRVKRNVSIMKVEKMYWFWGYHHPPKHLINRSSLLFVPVQSEGVFLAKRKSQRSSDFQPEKKSKSYLKNNKNE